MLSALSMSCSDDDDDKKSEEQVQQEAEQANNDATTFWSVVGQLAGITNYTEDYKDQQFEPTIGIVDEGNALRRIVATNGLTAAVERFNDLTGAHITESTTTYEWKNDAVGTLTWTKGDSRDYATVDVDIKQMPKLQQIVYRDGDQMGTNGSFNGAAYYRFGDVVSRQVGNTTEYWICVRPAFGPESKQTSHWVCINCLPEKNIKHKSSGGIDWYVPTGLGNDKEHIRNLAEMLYAILYPGQWAANLQNDEKLTVFHDFHHDKLKYHAAAFWHKVQKNWKEKHIFQTIFNAYDDKDAIDILRTAIAKEGLHFLYNGYKWSFFGNKCTLFQAAYTGKNMKTETLTEKETDVKNWPIDFRTPNDDLDEKLGAFFEDPIDSDIHRWVVRCAKGSELSTGKYDEKRPLQGCTEVYRYYDNNNTLTKAEILLQKDDPQVGDILGRNGKFYGTGSEAKLDNTTAVGIVIYRGEDADPSWDEQACGLALALDDARSTTDPVAAMSWATDDYINKHDNSKTTHVKQVADFLDIGLSWKNDNRGWAASQELTGEVSGLQSFIDAFCNNDNYALSTSITSVDNCVSKWYLPTAGQIGHAFDMLATNPEMVNSDLYGTKTYNNYYFGDNASHLMLKWVDEVLKPLFTRYMKEGDRLAPNGRYWLATQMPVDTDWDRAWYFTIDDNNGYGLNDWKKTEKFNIRPIVAFKRAKP